MSLATKQELEAVIAAVYNDLTRTLEHPRTKHGDDEWALGFRTGVSGARDLLGIAVKTYRINIPNINTETEK